MLPVGQHIHTRSVNAAGLLLIIGRTYGYYTQKKDLCTHTHTHIRCLTITVVFEITQTDVMLTHKFTGPGLFMLSNTVGAQRVFLRVQLS